MGEERVDEPLTELGELGAADAADGGEGFHGVWPALGHFEEWGVGKDDEGRHAHVLSDGSTQGAEGIEECLLWSGEGAFDLIVAAAAGAGAFDLGDGFGGLGSEEADLPLGPKCGDGVWSESDDGILARIADERAIVDELMDAVDEQIFVDGAEDAEG